MIICYEDGWDTPHEGQSGSLHTLSEHEEYYDPVVALHEVVMEVTGYIPPEPPKFRFGFL